MPYKWLDPTKADLAPFHDILTAVDKKDWCGGKKNLYARFYMEQYARFESENRLNQFKLDIKDIKSWKKLSAFKKLLETTVEQDKEKFRMASMVGTIAATLFFFFCRALWDGIYLVNFSVDALVGVAALALLVVQLKIKYRLVGQYGSLKDYVLTDGLAGILCILFKVILPPSFDFSLFILLMNYFIQKKRFFRTMDAFAKDN